MRGHRKTAPAVRNGRVQRKNNWRPSVDNIGQPQVSIGRQQPGRGHRHVLRCADVYSFVQVLPDWPRLATQLAQVLLARGSSTAFGWFRRGTVAVCALPRDLSVTYERALFDRDVDFLDRLGVPYEFSLRGVGNHLDGHGWYPEPVDDNWREVRVQFTPATAHAFQLVRTLVHELGHHLDHITNHRDWCTRGEPFAERYEREQEAEVWKRYLAVFGDPRRQQ